MKDNQRDAHDRWWVNERSFRPETDYRWPYPQSEQDINPNLRKQINEAPRANDK